MTLREFTDKYAPLPDATFGPHAPQWRKVFPTNLRQHRIIDKKGCYKNWIFFTREWTKEVSHLELEQQWERIHAGEVIDTEWRKVYVY